MELVMFASGAVCAILDRSKYGCDSFIAVTTSGMGASGPSCIMLRRQSRLSAQYGIDSDFHALAH
jgi:hypothetical protein